MHAASSVSTPKGVMTSGFTYPLNGTLPGMADGSIGALSFFTKLYDNGNTSQTKSYFKSTPINIGANGTEYLTISLTNGGSTLSAVSTSFQALATNAENHIVVEWDTNAAAGAKKLKCYVDGAEIALTITDASAAFALAYSAIGGITVGYQASVGLREYMLWLNTIPTFPAALTSLRTSSNAPTDVGESGQYLSVRPDIYLSLRGAAVATSFASNRGKSGGVWSFTSGRAYPDRTRIVGYGDSNMATGYANTYASQLGDLLALKIIVANHGVANATLASIDGYIQNGGTQGRPSIAWIKANWPDAIFVIEGGGNSLPVDGTGGITSATLLSYWASMVSRITSILPDARYIVQGISTRVGSETGTYKRTVLDETNAGLLASHGARYFDVDNYLRSDQSFIDAGISKTAQDITNLSNGIMPASYLADGLVHLNTTAHNLLTPRALALMQSLGYL